MPRLEIGAGTVIEAGGLRACVYRSHRKTLAIQLRPDLGIVLRAPYRVAEDRLRDFLSRRKGWIEHQRLRIASVAAEPAEPRWVAGERLAFLGGELELRVERSRAASEGTTSLRASSASLTGVGTTSARIAGGLLVVRTPGRGDPEAIRRAVERLFAREAAGRLTPIFEACLAHPAAARLPRPSLRFRSMKSRWGSCDPARRVVTLNSRLVRRSPELVRFVIMHELAHLAYRRHDAGFYEFLGRLCPGWERLRAALAGIRP